MKRLILVFSCLFFCLSLASLPARAQNPQGAGTDGKSKKIKVHRFHWWHHEKKQRTKTPPLYSVPKSVGWWHHRGPGPAGAGTK